MLTWFDSENEVRQIPRSRQRFYQKGKNKLTQDEYDFLKSYISQTMDNLSVKDGDEIRFLVPGWQAPKSWEHLPLDIIWTKVYPNDKVSCALWYGLLVMETVIGRVEHWRGIKTNFSREFDQTVYWTKTDEA